MATQTRLTRKEKAKDIRLASIFILLTLVLALTLIFVGIPLLIKMAVFLGNLRTTSKMPEKGDIIPPSPPRIIAPFEATNSSQLSLTGYTEPGATIKIYNSGLSLTEVVADTDGLFTIENLNLTLGRNEITAVAQDLAGNISQSSTPSFIEYDTSPPKLEITSPKEGATINGINNKIIIEGITDEGARLIINSHSVIVEPEGKFNYQYLLKEGENILIITASDIAGNKIEKELKINYSP